MAPKRKSLGTDKVSKKARKAATPSDDDLEAEMQQYAAPSTLVDPMIDVQGSDSDGDEEDDDDDDDDHDHDVPEVPAPTTAESSAGPSRRNLYKAPTLAELDELRAAEASGGNAFSLQLDELLKSTLLPTTPAPALKTLLGAVHDLVHGLPSLPAVAPRKAVSRLKGRVNVPFPGPAALSPLQGEPKWTLGFEAPAEVLVAGSWGVCGGYRKAKGQAGNVDVVVVMPQDMFSAKDRTAYRYFHKRAHYLSVIAAALKAEAKKQGSPLHGAEVEWEYVDARRPIISITAGKAQGLKHAIDIRIHASIVRDTFPLATLYPSKSLIRTGDDESIPTPQCASSILQDTLHKPALLHLHRLSQALDERVAAKFLALWRIWAARRGIPVSRGGSGYFASMLLGWVVDGGLLGGKGEDRAATKRARGLGKGLGAWGALRAAWEFLAHTDFEASPVFMAEEADATPIPHAEFTDAYADVFVDPSGTVNVLAEWEKGEVELVRHYARETLAMLEDTGVDRFAEVFLHNQTLGPAAFDEYIIVDTSDIDADSDDFIKEAERPNAIDRLATRAAKVVRRGLTDRVKLVRAEVLGSTTFSLGLLLNGAAATRILDMGPIAGDAAGCEAFRALWGEKAEMRRFKDGTIAESVVWPLARPEDQTLIPGQAAEWLLKKHLGDVGVAHVSSGDEWLSILQVPAAAREAINVAGSEKLGFQPMMTGYDTLYKLLKGVDSELPLAILHVAPASELLRYASPFVPHPIDIARAASAPESLGYIPVAEVTLQFESSPRWPDDLAAIQKLKLALFDKVARVISAHLRGVRVSIAFDADASDIDDSASLEVFLPDGMAFRIRIHHERERTLLERALEPPAPGIPRNLSPPPRKLVQAALARHIKRFKQQPAHHAAMAPMHHRFPSFSTAVRLLKRWAAAHMLSPHISAEALELLTARTYLDSGARAPPSSAAAGFLRTLDFLASWDWAASPAFIPIHAMTRDAASASGRPRFPAEQRATALAAFEKRRTGTEAWVLVTETDEAGTAWTSHVTRVVAARVAALAGASLALAREGEFSVSALFATPLEHYDVVLHLSEGTRAAEALDAAEELSVPSSSFRNLAETRALRPGFDPASLLVSQLQHVYGDSLLAFHDAFGGRTLGLVWNPARNAARAFKPFLGYNSSPADCDAALVEINRDAVVAEIARLGAGIIERVNRRR